MHITPIMKKKVLVKSLGVLKGCDYWLSDGEVEQTLLDQNNGALWDFTEKCKFICISKQSSLFLQ